jgi:arylsulfatase A-like enzyme
MAGLSSRTELLKRVLVTWAVAMLLLGVFEWAVLMLLDATGLHGLGARLLLLVLGVGNLAPYALLALVPLLLIERLWPLLENKLGRRNGLLAAAGAVFVLALPYAIPLGSFTFSGPAARAMAFHGLFVPLASALLAGSFALAGAVHAWGFLRRKRVLGLAFTAFATFACVWISRTTLANEYEKLHVFLAIWSLIFSALFASVALHPGQSPRPGVFWAAAALLPVTVLAAALIAGRVPAAAWLLWSHSGSSRYISKRVRLFEKELARDGSNAEMLLKPRLETEQTRAARRARAAQQAPHIVIFSVDGLRPDHLGAYGYKRHPTSPNIDRFAARGVRFLNAFSSYPQTASFNSSLLLGRYMSLGRKHIVPPSFQEKAVTRLLHERGYHVLVKAWFEHPSRNSFNPAIYKIDTHLNESKKHRHVFEEPLEKRLPVLEQHLQAARAAGKPSFMWMHLLGTHPVRRIFVPDPAFQFGPSPSDQYDSAIAGSDRWLEHVEKLMLTSADPARPTVWIICSDHGVRVEQDGRDLYAGIVRVPLIIVTPALSPAVRREPIDTSLDLAATVLDFAGIAPPEAYDGISLLPLLEVGDPEAQLGRRLIPLKRGRWQGAVYGSFKLLEFDGALSLVNTDEDPQEQKNLVDRYQGLARRMREQADVELQRRGESMARGMQPDADEVAEADAE